MTEEVEKYVNDCMDWNDSIENDGTELTTVEEGDYTFRISGFERARYIGSAKSQPATRQASPLTSLRRTGNQPFVSLTSFSTARLNGSYPLSSEASVKKSTVRNWSWTGLKCSILMEGHTSSLEPTPTTAVRKRPSTI